MYISLTAAVFEIIFVGSRLMRNFSKAMKGFFPSFSKSVKESTFAVKVNGFKSMFPMDIFLPIISSE